MQSTQDDVRFPGRGRTLGSGQNTAVNSDSNLQARLLDNSSPNNPSDIAAAGAGQRLSNERYQEVFFILLFSLALVIVSYLFFLLFSLV